VSRWRRRGIVNPNAPAGRWRWPGRIRSPTGRWRPSARSVGPTGGGLNRAGMDAPGLRCRSELRPAHSMSVAGMPPARPNVDLMTVQLIVAASLGCTRQIRSGNQWGVDVGDIVGTPQSWQTKAQPSQRRQHRARPGKDAVSPRQVPPRARLQIAEVGWPEARVGNAPLHAPDVASLSVPSPHLGPA